MEERYLSLAEATEALGISERTAYRWIKSGKLRAYKPGRDYRIPESAIKEAVEESEVRPKAPGRSSPQPSLNDALEDVRSTTERFEGYHAIQKALDGYREQWEKRLAEENFDKAALEEAGLALKAFWPAVTAAADAEMGEGTRWGVPPEEAAAQSVLLPAIQRFQVLCERVDRTYREKYEPAATVYVFPHGKAS